MGRERRLWLPLACVTPVSYKSPLTARTELNSGDSATLLTNSIATEARQQYTFRQFAGAHPVPESFIPGARAV